ncbi:MAG: hypothetical protein AAF490_03740 [Chloroflexota bacterium]
MTNISNLADREKLAQPWKDRWTVLWWAIENLYTNIQQVTELKALQLDQTVSKQLKDELASVDSAVIKTHREKLNKLIDKAVDQHTVATHHFSKPDEAFQAEQLDLIEKLQQLLSDYSRSVYDALELNLILTDKVRSNKYSMNYTFGFFFEQIATDLTILQKTLFQRFSSERYVGFSEFILYLGDQLANHALKPAETHHFISKSGAVICHLEKQLNIRLIPYANVVFIGIPPHILPTAFGNNFKMSTDFLAIAHEIGHFIYWQGHEGKDGEPLYQVVPQRIKNLPSFTENDWRLRWVEEIFADVYACLVAGPVMALEFQRLLSDNLPEHFKMDREKHPIDELRPFILNNILRKIKDSQGNPLYLNVPDILDQAWQESNPNTDPLTAQYTISGMQKSQSGAEIITAVLPIIEEILTIFAPLSPSSPNEPWTTEIKKDTPVDSLYEDFKSRQFEVLMSEYNHDNDFDPHNHDSKYFKAIKNANHINKRVSEQYLESVLFLSWSVEGPEGEINPD